MIDGNRPDGYPNDPKFDEAATKTLEARKEDEQQADNFLQQMANKLLSYKDSVTHIPPGFTPESWKEHCQQVDEMVYKRCYCTGCAKIEQREADKEAPTNWYWRNPDSGRQLVFACSLECMQKEWTKQT